ncbi:unnamed protein product [Candidula unifasciata]|uniref:G-protein coupled receptors family 1 profile domain-containing protein n=1 Tax=Candidula unifasciata TaxID=100452 RepID=A0A8S3YVJ0_9EUPU|nr:unnamed protein product [Candidula unifasciata]
MNATLKEIINVNASTVSNETHACVIHSNFGMYIVFITLIISSLSIIECMVVIFVTWFTVTLHSNTNILVASLAVNDLLLAIAFMGNQVSVVPGFLLPSVKSKLFMSLIYGVSSGSTKLSIMHMMVIAVDRYIQIAHPFYYMKAMTKKKIYVILICLWITCLIFIIIPVTIFYNDKYYRECIILHQPLAYSVVGVAMYFISLIMIFFCYFKIAHVAFKHKQSAISRRLGCNLAQSETEQRENMKAALRSVKYLALMFGVFFVATCPPFLLTSLGYRYSFSENVYLGLFSLVPIHSVINFLIYGYMNQEFQTSLVKKWSAIKRYCSKCRF